MGIMARRRMKERKKGEIPAQEKPKKPEKPKPTAAKAKRKIEKIPASLLNVKDE